MLWNIVSYDFILKDLCISINGFSDVYHFTLEADLDNLTISTIDNKLSYSYPLYSWISLEVLIKLTFIAGKFLPTIWDYRNIPYYVLGG